MKTAGGFPPPVSIVACFVKQIVAPDLPPGLAVARPLVAAMAAMIAIIAADITVTTAIVAAVVTVDIMARRRRCHAAHMATIIVDVINDRPKRE